MHQPRHRGMLVLTARVCHFPGGGVSLLNLRHNLSADGAFGVFRINEIEVVWGNGHRQLGVGKACAVGFPPRKIGQMFTQLLKRGDTVLQLPSPVVPVGVRHLCPCATIGRAKPLQPSQQIGRLIAMSLFAGEIIHRRILR